MRFPADPLLVPVTSPQLLENDALESPPEVQMEEHFQNASAWSTFHRIRYRVRRAGGEWIAQEREFLDRGDAVALLPYCPETGKVLLTRQFRMPVYIKRPDESLQVEVCGGILDEQDPAVTAQREAEEELGLHVTKLKKVFEAYSTPGSVTEKVHYFVATYIPAQRVLVGGGLRHEGEEVEVLELPFAEALQMVANGRIQDVRTLALLFWLQAQGVLHTVNDPPKPGC